ncbi:hypothetical protein [Nonomuraea cavernae]|uniref:Secreted protein n=1 Tax=Nonomuraea cavernae TaxID=2045107 RepID=A0A917YRL9_9ACTN|nr:hypothetical protein [Nonomuraea cavernae]MCA2183813.1 hypothetical protein [Nonomuraea cavernae]GGO61441.1 hypothetical protein GCM10012289_03680 [Nonomuraea cavernae]
MIRRILVGAAMAGIAFGFSASAASADVGPNPVNTGNSLLSQISVVDDAYVLNNVLNDSIKNIDVLTIAHLENVAVDVANNN